MTWLIKSFNELSTAELYAILRLRSEVFVVEQHCVYLDPDNKDLAAFHLMGWEGDELVAYTRILPPGISYKEASVGRVVTAQRVRRNGFGKTLMEQTIIEVNKLFPHSPIKISAQVYLLNFYSSLGFIPTSDPYLEDGIPHIEMLRT